MCVLMCSHSSFLAIYLTKAPLSKAKHTHEIVNQVIIMMRIKVTEALSVHTLSIHVVTEAQAVIYQLYELHLMVSCKTVHIMPQ